MRPPRWLTATYALLMGLYPADFRQAVGLAMRRDLADGWSRARATRGRGSALGFALRQLTDLMANVSREWRSPTGPRVPAARQGPGPWARALLQDLAFAAKSLRRDPAFACTVATVVGLGIAAVVTVYGMLDAILLEPLPYPEPERIVSMAESYRVNESKSVAYPNYVDWRQRNRSFEDIAARSWSSFSLTGMGPARSVWGMGTTSNFLELFGVAPLRGRLFTGAEETQQARVAVVSEGLWRERLGASEQVIGRELRLDGETYTIVGLIAEQSEFPLAGAEFWVPLPITIGDRALSNRGSHPGMEAFARMLPGLTLEEARADLDRVAGELAVEYPDSNAEAGVLISALRNRVLRDSATTLWTLFVAVVAVMLGVCANVASLMLARASRRSGEIAVRAALGAGRSRLMRQMVAEGALLSGVSGALGLGLAAGALRMLRTAESLDLPRLATLEIDPSVAFFALAAAAVSGLLFSAVPAMRLASLEPSIALRGSGTGRGATLDGKQVRRALVAVQVAFAVVLLAGASLMARSLQNLATADTGLAPGVVITASLGPPQSQYPENDDRVRLYREFAERLATLPGVARVAGGDPLPMSGRNVQMALSNDGFPQIDEQGQRVDVARVMPGYFGVLGIELVAGRGFRETDTAGDHVVVIDETLAGFLWPDGTALGNRLRFRGPSDERPWFTVVGVAEHVKNYGVRATSRHEVYLPYTISAWGMSMVLELEDPSARASVVAGMRDELFRMDPELPLTRVESLGGYIEGSVAAETLVARTLAGFASAALLVAIIGLYGVVAYSVAQRTREFGIRMALGAARGRVLRTVLAETLGISGVGIVLGLAAALASARLIASFLYDVRPADPVSLVGVASAMVVVALLASAIPARQALRVDPAVALRD